MRGVEAAYRLLRPVLNRWVIVALTTLALVTMGLLTVHLTELFDGARWLLRHPLPLLAAVALAWVSAALHEVGHGLAALRHGCRVTRVSIATLHCHVDDYLYLRSAAAQVAIAGAGGLVNALVLAPAALGWAMLEPGTDLRLWLGGLLFVGWIQTVVNYVPLPPLDGYRMLGHALGTANLATESRRFVRLAFGGALRRRPGVGAYPARARLLYPAYALTSLVLVGGALAGLVLACSRLVDRRPGAVGVVVGLVTVSMTVAGWLARPRRKDTPTMQVAKEAKSDG